MPYSFDYEVWKGLFIQLGFNVLPLCFRKELKSKRFHHVMITALLKYLLSAFACLDNILPNSFVWEREEQTCFYVCNAFQGCIDADGSENSCGQEEQTMLRTEQGPFKSEMLLCKGGILPSWKDIEELKQDFGQGSNIAKGNGKILTLREVKNIQSLASERVRLRGYELVLVQNKQCSKGSWGPSLNKGMLSDTLCVLNSNPLKRTFFFTLY